MMTYKELLELIETWETKINEEKDKVAKEKARKELAKYKTLLKHALEYSEEVKDPDTAVIMYTTKQMNLFIALQSGVCRRIRNGYYINKQRYLLNDLFGSKKDVDKALKIMRFDKSKFKDVDWSKIKFEMIENELDRGFWTFRG